MSQKFKAGDRIRCINIPYETDDLTVDAIYTVTQVGNSMDANAPYMIMNNGDQLWTSGWKEMFELVEKEMSFKDKVFEYASSDSRSVSKGALISSLALTGVFNPNDEVAKASLIDWLEKNPENYCDAGLEKVRKHFGLEPPKSELLVWLEEMQPGMAFRKVYIGATGDHTEIRGGNLFLKRGSKIVAISNADGTEVNGWSLDHFANEFQHLRPFDLTIL